MVLDAMADEAERDVTGSPGKEKEPTTSMKVYFPEAAEWKQLAALRGGISIADLMRHDDVREFVSHLINFEAEEIRKRRQKKKR